VQAFLHLLWLRNSNTERSGHPTASEPLPPSEEEPANETKQQAKPSLQKDVQTLFNDMIAKAKPLPDAEHLKCWVKEHGIAVRRLRGLRKNCPDPRLHKRGRRPANPG
jgi:hypothetical protein